MVLLLSLAFAAFAASAEVQIIDGVAYECRDGICMPAGEAGGVADSSPAGAAGPEGMRIAQGYMAPDEFLAFLGGEPSGGPFNGKGLLAVVLLAVLGGLAMNLTPCVLPMVPVTLMIVGRSAARGAWYGAGIVAAYGALGAAAAFGGVAFGSLQGTWWFNAAVAAVFAVLALSMFGLFRIDFSGFRHTRGAAASGGGAVFAFAMGAVGAALAGACVAPVLVSVLVLTAEMSARGDWGAIALPFAVGLGMALPWPLAGAGLKVLPRPGAWMRHVNRVFGAVALSFAAWYGWLACTSAGVALSGNSGDPAEVTPATFAEALARAERPVLVDCWASWCKNCAAMEHGTLRDPRVVAALRGFTVIRLRAEDIGALRALPGFGGVMGLPAFAVLPAPAAEGTSP